MLKRKYILVLILAVVVATATIMVLFRDSPRHFDWEETYDEGEPPAYGTYVIYELLQGRPDMLLWKC